MLEKFKLYGWICYVNLFISTFTFGGGYVVVPMIKKYFVQKKKFFTEEELITMAAVAQSSPGAIAVNLSVLAGQRTAGAAGIFLSAFCAVLPPMAILGFISSCYDVFSANIFIATALKGMQACAAALIADLIFDMYAALLKEKSKLPAVLAPLSFAACTFLNMNVIVILLSCCLICLLSFYIQKKHGRRL